MSFSNKLITEKNGSRYGRMIYPWLRRKQDMIVDTPSRRDGMTYEEELSKRQQGGTFIFEVVMQLTHGKGEHGLSGVAVTLFNRFYNIHSFKRCDFRDVAAACVFLAGKNEDTPKKLKYVVNQLWQYKYPNNKAFPSEQHFIDQCNVVTFLEEIILKSISFDINVDLPHQYVLKLMRDVEKGRNVYKEMVKTAYYMATDVLIITDWSVRYSCTSIATACVNIAAYFHNIVMDEIVPLDLADQWYRFQDQSMTRGEVDVMTNEFIDIYARNPQLHIGSLKKIDPLGKVKIVGRSPPQVSSTLSSTGSSSNLKKIDLESYKGRQKPGVSTELSSTTSTSSRPSFLPDVKNQKVVEQKLMEQRMKDAAQQKQHHQHHHNNRHHNHHQSSHSSHHHSMNHHSSSSVSSLSSTPLSNEMSDSLSGPFSASFNYPNQKSYEDRSVMKRPLGYEDAHSAKKSRMDYKKMTFVASTSTSTTSMDNGFFSKTTHQESLYSRGVSQMKAGKPIPSLMSMPTSQPQSAYEPPSAYQQMCMDYENQQRKPSSNEPPRQQQQMSSTQQISPPDESSPPLSTMILLPPPPPPPILPRRVEEIEDGELV